jgi:hypothetical protein
MKRITKATYAAFVAALASECEAVGIQSAPHPWNCDKPCYQITTRAGLYTFHPMEPYGEPRKHYDITVFGRFQEDTPTVRAICGGGSGKWNFHAGYRTPEEAREFATHIVTRILLV